MIKLRKMRSVGHVAHLVGNRSTYRVFVGKPERNRPLGRPGLKMEDNIEVELKRMELEGADWFYLAQVTDKWRVPVETVKRCPVP
jgi:hypothetical protein